MGIRYRVNDLPLVGTGAFTPLASTNPVASSYGLVHIDGAPGTKPVPVLNPQDQWGQPDLTAAGAPNSAQGSDVVPNVIFPAIYVPSTANMGPEADAGIGMARRRFNELPVPARTWIPLTGRALSRPRIGGRRAMPWPRAFQRFPSYGSSTDGSTGN